MEGTNLPNCLITTIHSLAMGARRAFDESNLLLNELDDLYSGVWMIETTSITERRKETGSFHSIVRLICFYKQSPDSDIQYLTEDSNGEFHKWENCSFYALLPHDRGWSDKQVIRDRNRVWAKEAVTRHKLKEELKEKETIFFDPKNIEEQI